MDAVTTSSITEDYEAYCDECCEDCCKAYCRCPCIRDPARKFVKKYKSWVLDTSAILARITLISLLVYVMMEIYLSIWVDQCDNVIYMTSTASAIWAIVTICLVGILVLLKFLENENKPIRTARSFLLALYFSGIAFLLYESLSYTDEFCVEYVRPRSRPTRDSNHKYALSLGRRCKLYESLADDCGRSFLKRELNVLLFFCTITWIIGSMVSIWYFCHARKRSDRASNPENSLSNQDIPLQQLEPQPQEPQPEPEDPGADPAGPEEGDEGNEDGNQGAAQIVPELPDLSSPDYSSGFSSGNEESVTGGLGKPVILNVEPVKCKRCNALIEPTKDKGSSASKSLGAKTGSAGFSSSQQPGPSSSTRDYSEFCQNCISQFGNSQ